ncbi:MAG: sugar nucleotide-binding protein, partial [Anaerolineae bacterium]
RSKALAEEAVGASGARAVIVRTSLIYGPAVKARQTSVRDMPWRQWDRQTRWVIGDLKAGEPVRLFTDERRCPIWVRSLATALLELARSDVACSLPASVVHVAGAQPLSRYEFGLRLAHFHGVDPGGITPALSRDSGLIRPLDCTLDCSRARALLHTPLPGVDQVLRYGKRRGGNPS